MEIIFQSARSVNLGKVSRYSIRFWFIVQDSVLSCRRRAVEIKFRCAGDVDAHIRRIATGTRQVRVHSSDVLTHVRTLEIYHNATFVSRGGASHVDVWQGM